LEIEGLSLFPRKKVQLGDLEVEIEGYRVADSEYVLKLLEAQNQLILLADKYNKIREVYDNLSAEDITEVSIPEETAKEIKELKDRVDELQIQIDRAAYPLAQRGLKRAFYRDTDGYREAQRENRLTEYIDSLPDIEVPPVYVREVVNTMLELSKPELVVEGKPGDLGKRETIKKKRKPSGG